MRKIFQRIMAGAVSMAVVSKDLKAGNKLKVMSIDEKTGKVTVQAEVLLKNGKTKTVKMTVTVKP